MRVLRLMLMGGLLALATACASPTASAPPASAPSAAAPPPASSDAPANGRITGTVQDVQDAEVTLQDGEQFAMRSDAQIIRVLPADAESIEPGEFVAVTAKREEDGKLLASEVQIFPESMRGQGEGQRPMDAGNLMTNATVEGLSLDLMTNATVDEMTSQTFTVSYPNGTDQVLLAGDAQVRRFEAASAADLQPGTAISAFVSDGSARFITIM